jgi:ubiquinone/menaquinone biosynthesis C-methylase UbiE
MEELDIDQRILQRLGAAQKILDVGCGDGRLVNLLAHQTQRWVVGLDISSHGFVEARQVAGRISVPHLVQCVKGDGRQIGFKSDHFEAVIMMFTLHHIDETGPALREVYRVLKPRGRLLVCDWVVTSDDQDRSGCYRFTLGEIRRMVQEAKFQRVEVKQVDPGLVLVVGEAKL